MTLALSSKIFYCLVNSKGLEIIESAERLALAEMQNLVGNPGVSAYIEVAYYNSFSDKAISLICDDEFLRKEINPTCKTCNGDIIHGQVVILGTSLEAEDFALLLKSKLKSSKLKFDWFVVNKALYRVAPGY
ncbi:DUF3846 domain-containing protein [Microcoleus vaginatus ZQ-A3]|nr:DUF3846 domain-containing protein [Microcoleus sp. FACHB-45]